MKILITDGSHVYFLSGKTLMRGSMNDDMNFILLAASEVILEGATPGEVAYYMDIMAKLTKAREVL